MKKKRIITENMPEYSNNQLNSAKGTNPSRASREFDVPQQAILNHVNGVSKTLEVRKPTFFSQNKEKLIVDLLIALNG